MVLCCLFCHEIFVDTDKHQIKREKKRKEEQIQQLQWQLSLLGLA